MNSVTTFNGLLPLLLTPFCLAKFNLGQIQWHCIYGHKISYIVLHRRSSEIHTIKNTFQELINGIVDSDKFSCFKFTKKSISR